VTAKIPPDGFVVARAVGDAERLRIRGALLALHTDRDGREALSMLLQAERLAPVEDAVVAELQALVARASA